MQYQETNQCTFCCEPFDNNRHMPRDVGCGSNHLICTECLMGCLRRNEEQIVCYFHNSDRTIKLNGKGMNDFPAKEVSKINKTISEQVRKPQRNQQESQDCVIHGRSEPATFICLKCHDKICAKCSKEHFERSHDVVPLAGIQAKKREIQDQIENELEISSKSEERIKKELRNKKEDLCKSIDDQINECKRELMRQAEIAKRSITSYLDSLGQASNQELNKIDNDFTYWKKELQEKINRYGRSDKSEEALFDLHREQTSNKNLQDYVNRVRREVQSFELEISKISVKISQKFEEFSKNQLFSDIACLGKEKQEQKKASNAFEDGYKPYNPHQNNARERPRNHDDSQPSRDHRGRSKSVKRSNSKHHKDYEEKKESEPLPKQYAYNSYHDPQKQKSANSFIDEINDLFTNINIPLTARDNDGISLTSQVKPLFDNNAIYDFKQWLWAQSSDRLGLISHVEFTCFGLDKIGAPDLGDCISKLTSLTSLSLKFVRSENMAPKDLKNLGNAFGALNQLTKLTLNFKNWKSFTDNVAEILMRELSGLRSLRTLDLDFSGCFKLRDEGVRKTVNYLSKLENLEKLNLNFEKCQEITDACYSEFKKKLSPMRSLIKIEIDVSDCPYFNLDVTQPFDKIKVFKR